MVLRKFVTVQSYTSAANSEGQKLKTWATLKSLYVDIQPVGGQSVLESFGVKDLDAGARVMFFEKDATVLELHRVVDGSDTYEIRKINRWYNHDMAYLVPVQSL